MKRKCVSHLTANRSCPSSHYFLILRHNLSKNKSLYFKSVLLFNCVTQLSLTESNIESFCTKAPAMSLYPFCASFFTVLNHAFISELLSVRTSTADLLLRLCVWCMLCIWSRLTDKWTLVLLRPWQS